MKTIRKQFLINSLYISYLEYGEDDNSECLLFFHGGRLQASTFHSTLLRLSTRYRVIAPDIPGFGFSSTPQQVWSLDDYATFFQSFINQLSIQKITIIGYSMGGGIAICLSSLLARRNITINKIVLIDPIGLTSCVIDDFRQDISRFLFYLSHPWHIRAFLSLMTNYVQFLLKHIVTMGHIAKIRQKCAQETIPLYLNTLNPIILWADKDTICKPLSRTQSKKLFRSVKLHMVSGNHDWIFHDQKTFHTLLLKSLSF